MSNYSDTIEELAISKTVSLGHKSKGTAYRYAREINGILAREKADWHVHVNVKDRLLTAMPNDK